MSHASSFVSDLSRLKDLIPRISVLPLGSGPLAGNPFQVDRELLRKELGFASLSINSMNVSSVEGFTPREMMNADIVLFLCRASLIVTSSQNFSFGVR